MNELALFAGAGGGILGGMLLGWRTVCAVEIDPYAAAVLAARQNDGTLSPFPIWDDVCTFDGNPWRGVVDVVSGGFPCQDISAAGKGVGIDGARSGLWREMHRIIGEVRPRYALVENSPLLVGRGLAVVLGDLAEIGYDAAWCVLGADDVGAPHVRKRIWILAHDPHADRLQRTEQGGQYAGAEEPGRSGADGMESRESMDRHSHGDRQKAQREIQSREQTAEPSRVCGYVADSDNARAGRRIELTASSQREGYVASIRHSSSTGLPIRGVSPLGQPAAEPEPERPDSQIPNTECTGLEGFGGIAGQPEIAESGDDSCSIDPHGWWETEPAVGRVVDGMAHRVDRIRCLGNGQVPLVAACAFRYLHGILRGKEGA